MDVAGMGGGARSHPELASGGNHVDADAEGVMAPPGEAPSAGSDELKAVKGWPDRGQGSEEPGEWEGEAEGVWRRQPVRSRVAAGHHPMGSCAPPERWSAASG
jgi:hypothetical protein